MLRCHSTRLIIVKEAPMVASVGGLKRRLTTDWKRTLKKTSQLCLKHLKGYHKSVIKLIQDEIKEEEAKLRRCVDFFDNFGQIYQLANKTFRKFDQFKRRKLNKLLKGCKQKKEQQKKKEGKEKEKYITGQSKEPLN